MRAKRVDANQKQIVLALRQLGWSVALTHEVGKGFPDLVCGKDGENYLVECKDGEKVKSARKLTDAQVDFHREWKGRIYVIESLEDVLKFDKTHRIMLQNGSPCPGENCNGSSPL